MRALILAAGRGSRMGGRTELKPKCLTPLAGRPLLHWQKLALQAAGVRELGVVRGYLAETLSDEGLVTFENRRWAETNMVMSLVCAEPWLESEPCIVSYADIVYRPETVRALMTASGDIVIAYDRRWAELWSMRFEDPLSDAETFRLGEDGALVEIGGRAASLEEIRGQYMGLLKFTPKGWASLKALLSELPPEHQDRLDMTSWLRLFLSAGGRIDTVPVDGGWCEVDSEQDLLRYEARISEDLSWSHDWRTPVGRWDA